MNDKIFSVFGTDVTGEHLFIFFGAAIFCNWLVKTKFASESLKNSKERRNNMPLWLPIVLWFAWILLVSGGGALTGWLSEKGALEEWKSVFMSYIAMGVLETLLIAAMLVTARMFFARRLKGFGLEEQTVSKDLGAAILNLWAILPLVYGLIFVVSWAADLLLDKQMQTNPALETLSKFKDGYFLVKAAVFVVAVLIVPVFEEILFRGLMQSAIRKVVSGPWVGIVLASILFAVMHSSWMHWPALFTLSLCLGYAYEKSGSLYRPIFIHMLFNLIGILATLSQTNGGGN